MARYAIDGTTLRTADTPDNRQHFGAQAYANVVSSFYSSKFSRYVEELLVAPVPNWVILAGYVSGGVARGLTVGVAVTLVALVFTDLQIHSYLASLAVFTLTAILFALGGQMALLIDASMVQYRVLNRSRGPADGGGPTSQFSNFCIKIIPNYFVFQMQNDQQI